jgi:DNA topoisomerase-1
VHGVASEDVNAYLRETTGEDFSAKDFRTWAGTVAAARELANAGIAASEREARQEVVAAIDRVAEQLGNTRAVSRNAYVHPWIVDGYLAGSGVALNGSAPRRARTPRSRLSAAERAVLDYLKGRQATSTRRSARR